MNYLFLEVAIQNRINKELFVELGGSLIRGLFQTTVGTISSQGCITFILPKQRYVESCSSLTTKTLSSDELFKRDLACLKNEENVLENLNKKLLSFFCLVKRNGNTLFASRKSQKLMFL